MGEGPPPSRKSDEVVHDRREEKRVQAVGLGHRDGWVFTDGDGKPIHPHALSQTFERIARRAGVPARDSRDTTGRGVEVMERWRHGAAIGGINGRCRVHCAELLRISGPCDLAEAEALRACEELRPWMRREFGWPLVEPGTIRLRKGDLARAEEAFVAADERAWSPHPGLALLRLAQGDVASASALIAEAIAHPFATPSKERPPFGDLRLAPLLDAQAEIAAAAGDVDTARRAADQLASIAASYHSRAIDACAALAGGQGGTDRRASSPTRSTVPQQRSRHGPTSAPRSRPPCHEWCSATPITGSATSMRHGPSGRQPETRSRRSARNGGHSGPKLSSPRLLLLLPPPPRHRTDRP